MNCDGGEARSDRNSNDSLNTEMTPAENAADERQSPDQERVAVSASVANAVDRSPPIQLVSKILFLDGLRGLAAILVVLTHAGYMKDLNLGPPAVDMFFVLSAFLLTMILEKKARLLFSQQASYHRWGLALADYFVRRFLRVYPLFAIVACVLAAVPPQERKRDLQIKHPEDYHLLDVLVFRMHPHILWTLPIEIGYYFLIPAIVIVHFKLGKLWWLLSMAGFVVVFYNGLYQWKYRKEHNVPWPHLPTFLCGSLGALVYTRIDRSIIKHDFVFKVWLVLVVRAIELALFVLLLSQMCRGLLFHWVVANPMPDTNRFVSFPITVLIVCEMLCRGSLASVLEWSLLRYAGKVSFSMYLLHIFIVYQPIVTHTTHYYDKFFLIWILVFLLSTASYYAIEWPCQRLAAAVGKWIKRKDAEVICAEAMSPKKPELSSDVAVKSSATELEVARAC